MRRRWVPGADGRRRRAPRPKPYPLRASLLKPPTFRASSTRSTISRFSFASVLSSRRCGSPCWEVAGGTLRSIAPLSCDKHMDRRRSRSKHAEEVRRERALLRADPRPPVRSSQLLTGPPRAASRGDPAQLFRVRADASCTRRAGARDGTRWASAWCRAARSPGRPAASSAASRARGARAARGSAGRSASSCPATPGCPTQEGRRRQPARAGGTAARRGSARRKASHVADSGMRREFSRSLAASSPMKTRPTAIRAHGEAATIGSTFCFDAFVKARAPTNDPEPKRSSEDLPRFSRRGVDRQDPDRDVRALKRLRFSERARHRRPPSRRGRAQQHQRPRRSHAPGEGQPGRRSDRSRSSFRR